MRVEEEGHARRAREAGGRPLPRPVRTLMTAAARVMTTLAARL
jgi:ubiquinone biosynthesis monooxygenase Coq7